MGDIALRGAPLVLIVAAVACTTGEAQVPLEGSAGVTPTGSATGGATGGGSAGGTVTLGAAGSAGSGSADLLGAWHGAGVGFPDGDQCLIFCENGRLFSGDRPCTEVDAGDFAQYLRYTVTGSDFEASAPGGVQMTGTFEVSGDVANFTIALVDGGQFVLPPMNRTADGSPLCSSDEPIWEGW